MNPLVRDIMVEMRRSDDAILESHGLTWAKWVKMRDDAAREMADSGQTEIVVDEYEIKVDSKPVRIMPASATISHYEYRLTTHKRRE